MGLICPNIWMPFSSLHMAALLSWFQLKLLFYPIYSMTFTWTQSLGPYDLHMDPVTEQKTDSKVKWYRKSVRQYK